MVSLIKFVKNHKKKLIFLVIISGGSYIVVKRWLKILSDASLLFSPKAVLLAERDLKIQKKREHYLTIKQTSDDASIKFYYTSFY